MIRKIKFVSGLVFVTFAVGVWATTAFAQANPRARADLYAMPSGSPSGSPTGTGTPAGYVVISEIPGPYLQSQVNVSGRVAVGEGGAQPGVLHGLHLWDGTCDQLFGHANWSGSEGGHPREVGDLPNLLPSSTGTFALTKATSRFVLAPSALNLWSAAPNSGSISVVVESSEDTGGGGGIPILCGELHCEAGTACVEGGLN